MISGCGQQLRTSFNGEQVRIYGLDFTAIFLMADAQGADAALLSEVLPTVERLVIAGHQKE